MSYLLTRLPCAAGLVAIGLSTGCCAVPVAFPPIIGHRPVPPIATPRDTVRHLRAEANPPIGWLAAGAGVVTVPFKQLGIFGWLDLEMRACASGTIRHAAISTDGFMTVDVELERWEIDGATLELGGVSRFVRAEICMCRFHRGQLTGFEPRARVGVCGRLKWDTDGPDGFLEVHPDGDGDLRLLSDR